MDKFTIIFSIYVTTFCAAQITSIDNYVLLNSESLNAKYSVSDEVLIDGLVPYFSLKLRVQPSEKEGTRTNSEMVLYHSRHKDKIGRGGTGLCCTTEAYHEKLCARKDSMILDFHKFHLKHQGHIYRSDTGDFYYWNKNRTLTTEKILPLADPGIWYFIVADCSDNSTYNTLNGTIVFHNAYGYLSAILFPRVPLYFSLATAYFGLTITWVSLMFFYNQNLVRMQYVMLVLLIVGFIADFFWAIIWNDFNTTGTYHKWYSPIGTIFSTAKITLIRTLILLISLGYSIVFKSLDIGSKLGVIVLTMFQGTLVGTLYYLSAEQDFGNPVPVLPRFIISIVVVLLDLFYAAWILYSFYFNIQTMKSRKPPPNRILKIYTSLLYGLIVAGVAIMVFFVVQNILVTMDIQDDLWSIWWIFDCFWEYVIFFMIAFVSFIWRPVYNNTKYDLTKISMEEESSTSDHETYLTLQEAPPMYRFKKEPPSPVSLKSEASLKKMKDEGLDDVAL